jgi:FKBP-type peptidyl-prolyl cis-trans isomerase
MDLIKMKVRLLFCWFLLSCFLNNLYSQKCECKINGKSPDYIYQNEGMPGSCVMFFDKMDKFYLCRDCTPKNQVPLSFPQNLEIKTYLQWLDVNKKSKITEKESIFIYEGLKQWEKAKKWIGFQVTASGLGYKIIQQGNGKKPEKGKNVKVHYKGSLEDGKVFDSSYDRGQPFEFPLGMGRVIKGWDEGIPLFNVGGKGILKIPPELGYGKTGAGNIIPPDATLIFEVEIISAD